MNPALKLYYPPSSGLPPQIWQGFSISWASLVAQMVKNLPTMQETWVPSVGQEDPLEKVMATHSSVLAWRIPWTEEPGRLQSMRLQKAGHDWETNTFTFLSPFLGEENHRGQQDLYCCDGNFHPMKGNPSSKIDSAPPPFKRFLYSQLSVLPRHFIDGICWNEIALWVALAKSFAISLKSNAIRKQSCGQERNPAPLLL